MKIVRPFVTLLVISMFFTLNISGQETFVVNGKVTLFHKYPLKNLKVTSKKTGAAVLTDSLGQFQLICNIRRDRIEIDEPGFKSMSRNVKRKNESMNIDLMLRKGQKNVDLVVSAGYITKEDVSYALDNFSKDGFTYENYSDIFSLIKDRFPLIFIDKSSSVPKMYLRSGEQLSSLSLDTAMKYEVDGMAIFDISNIVPSDIRTIDILKGTETAIYGSQGSSGILIITTKRN